MGRKILDLDFKCSKCWTPVYNGHLFAVCWVWRQKNFFLSLYNGHFFVETQVSKWKIFKKYALLLLWKRERVVSADMRFGRVASTSGVRTHRKNERFSLAPELPILIFGEAPHPFHVWIENTSWTFQEAIAYIRFDDYNYTVIL